MELFLRALGAVFLGIVLKLSLGAKGKEFSLLISLLVCVLVTMAGIKYLEPVIDFLGILKNLSGTNDQVITIILKITGIGLITEVASLICADSGSASLGKTLQLLGSSVILWLSIPMFSMLMELLQRILGEL